MTNEELEQMERETFEGVAEIECSSCGTYHRIEVDAQVPCSNPDCDEIIMSVSMRYGII